MFLICGIVAGYDIGHSRGYSQDRIIFYRRGYKAGYKAAPVSAPLSPEIPSPFPMFERQMAKYSCQVRVVIDPNPETIIRQNTTAAENICEKIAYKLLSDHVIRPVILDEHDGVMDVGASIYVVSNPTYDNYPNLVFFDREPMP